MNSFPFFVKRLEQEWMMRYISNYHYYNYYNYYYYYPETPDLPNNTKICDVLLCMHGT